MLKQLIATLLVIALLAPGCGKKKATDSAAGSGAASATAGIPGGLASGADSPIAPGPAASASAALATSMQQSNAEAIRALSTTPAAVKAAQLEKILDATIALENSEARDHSWDAATVIAKVGTDRAKLFAWVHDHTALVPYAGMLRGPVGVMMDRVGNSLDRALLLADLLTRAGGEVRLAHATLEPAAAETLATAWRKVARPTFPTTPDDAAAAANLLAAMGGDRAALEKRVAAQTVARANVEARAREQIAAQTSALAKMIEGTPAVAPADAAVFADHWWVQVKDGDAWSDLDPTQPGPGQTLATSTETAARDDVPDNLRHMLAIRVIGEVWHGDVREETTLVEHAFTPADFFGQRLTVTAILVDLPDAEKLDKEKDRPAAARAAVAVQTEWIPMIVMGTTPVVRFSVTDTGELYDLMDPNANSNRLGRAVQNATKNGVGGATQLLEGMGDGSDSAPAPKPVAGPHAGFTAEWIEFEVRTPNVAPRVVRRTVFDMLGAPADRSTAKPIELGDAAKLDRGLALMGQTEVLAQYARIPRGFNSNRLAKFLAIAKPTLVALAQSGGKTPPDELTTPAKTALPPPDELDDLGQVRFAWTTDKVFVDQIDVLTARRRLTSIDGKLRTIQAFDIVTNGVGSWGSPGEARDARLSQGIADTVSESVLRPCSANAGSCFRGPNTSDAFVGAKNWALITDPASAAIAALPAPARVVANGDLEQGYTIVAPPGSRPATWWRVRPETGETLGQAAVGGTAMTETIAVLQVSTILAASGFCYLEASGWRLLACWGAVALGGPSALAASTTLVGAVLGFAVVLLGGAADFPSP